MRRILLITLSNIGDAVLTTPVLERLHQCFPEAVVDIVTDQRSSELFTHCPYRGEIILKHKRQGWRGLLRLMRTLRRTRYDLIVDLRTDGLAYLLRAHRALTKWGRRPLGPHAVQHHMGVITALTGPDIPPTRVWLDDASRAFAAEKLEELPGNRWLAVGPGANWLPKIWPVHRFRELASLLADYFDGVVLLGGPKDRERSQAVGEGLCLPHLDLTGRTGLLQAAALLERCHAFVGNDSGLGHLASAVGTPTLIVFGPGQPERYHPWGRYATWVRGAQERLENLSAETVAERLRSHLSLSLRDPQSA